MIVKSKHGLRTCSSRRFQWYPTTYMCWAMTKPLLWIKLILSHSKGWVGLNTYRLWGIIGIVLMSTFLIHAYFLRSRHFTKPRLFSREISTVSGHKTMPERSVRSWVLFCVRSLMWGRKAMVKNRWVAWRAIRSPHFQSPLFHLATFSSQYSKMLIVTGLRCFFPTVSGTFRQKFCESDDVY